ncbi:DUF6508 domain-containing protein [Rhodococcus marinonascens]|uniref:DUF6508 domain-containing protein n=1 Tax=Rhodococcus marinonascens TaxID=38311 RepID=UPI0009355CEA|nr:DUF6508 domain-containing protein [Rhodococcus marinonascens]
MIDESRTGADQFADIESPLIGEAAGFFHDHNLIVAGFDWAAWEGGRDLLNLRGIRNLAPHLGSAEVLGMITSNIGVDRTSAWATGRALEDGSLPPLFERLLDFQPKAGH